MGLVSIKVVVIEDGKFTFNNYLENILTFNYEECIELINEF